MPLLTTKFEAGRILSGHSDAVSRMYNGVKGCPHSVGEHVMLHVEQDGDPVPYAIVMIKSIRPSSLEERINDNTLAEGEGFTNSTGWLNHFSQFYKGAVGGKVYRMQFIVKRLIERTSRWVDRNELMSR